MWLSQILLPCEMNWHTKNVFPCSLLSVYPSTLNTHTTSTWTATALRPAATEAHRLSCYDSPCYFSWLLLKYWSHNHYQDNVLVWYLSCDLDGLARGYCHCLHHCMFDGVIVGSNPAHCLCDKLSTFPTISPMSNKNISLPRPCPCQRHATCHLCGHRPARLHPLPGGRQPARHAGQVDQRWQPSPDREGESRVVFIRAHRSKMFCNG